MTAVTPDPQSMRLGLLLQLEHRARRASAEELGFVMVNETAQAVAYQQAALWQCTDETGLSGRLAALSGVAAPEKQAPYGRWLSRVLPIAAALPGDEPRTFGVADLPDDLANEWDEWLPSHALWCPLSRAGGQALGGLLYARTEPWEDGERQLLGLLTEHYAQCWILTNLPKTHVPWIEVLGRRRKTLTGGLVGLLLLAFFPIHESSLVPAEVVPIAPLQVRAPFDGIIDAIHVEPNAHVKRGEILVSLDAEQLHSHQQIAIKAKEIAEAEYNQASQEAMIEDKAKGKLAVLRAKIDQQEAEVAYLDDQLSRAKLPAPADGIAIFDSPNDWIGKPVSVGERIMLVADPTQVELELQVPMADAVTFETGADVTFFRNVAPEHPLDATVVFASYASSVTAEGISAYRFRAQFSHTPGDENVLRIGLRGTAKLYGARRPLVLWLLRRPLAVIRQWLPS